MLTKRMMLGAGALALALALAVSACSEDRAGGATGVSEAPSVPRANPPAAAAIALPATPEAVAAGNGGTAGGSGGGGGAVRVISSSIYGGHQVVLAEVTTSSGAKLTRVTLDGVRMAEFSEALGSESVRTNATVYADGQVLLEDMFNVTDAGSVVIPQQYLGLTARPLGGPQLQAAFPCAHELAMFGGASLWVSGALMWAKVQPYSLAAWIDLRLALTALGAASWNLAVCLHGAW